MLFGLAFITSLIAMLVLMSCLRDALLSRMTTAERREDEEITDELRIW